MATLMSDSTHVSLNGITAQAIIANTGGQRREDEHGPVGTGGDHHLFHHIFQGVRHGLQQTEDAHDVGTATHLNRSPDLAVPVDQEQQRDHHKGNNRKTNDKLATNTAQQQHYNTTTTYSNTTTILKQQQHNNNPTNKEDNDT